MVCMGSWVRNTLIEWITLGKCHGMLYKDICFKIRCNPSFIVDGFSKIHGDLEILPVWVSYQIFQSRCTLFSSPTLLSVSQTAVLKVHFVICSCLTASRLPLLATQKDNNYPVKSNYRSERNLASAARKQLRTYNCRPALLFQQYVIKALVCPEESYCMVELLTE